MRKILLAAAGFAALTGAAGLAMAQGAPAQGPERGVSRLFQGDANNDGVLTRQEFDTARNAHFAQMDADNNGQITRDERREMGGMRGDGRRGHHRGGHGGAMHLANADANNDGNITRDEFLARPTEHFDRLDANNDGVIGQAERPQRPERGDRAERRGERGERPDFDANNDGQLSRQEFAAMGAQLFDRMDANNDGRVTRQEAEAARPHRGRD